MSLPEIGQLRQALVEPGKLAHLTLPQWDHLIRLGRNADVLARIATIVKAHPTLDILPAQPRLHLESANILAERQRLELDSEVQFIVAALSSIACRVVLLKGAAYALAGLQVAKGRLMSDVDILVPRERLPEVESALMMHGWVTEAKSAYDERYYRTWMHELPPMRHFHRGTVIDVHHAILPISARFHPDSQALLKAARPAFAGSNVYVLSPIDMLLHSASHLFHEGELEQGFRGVVDLDALLREFGPMDRFWKDLVPRAASMELVRPLFYALRYAHTLMETPTPSFVVSSLSAEHGAPKSRLFLAMMDFLFLRALRPTHRSTSDRWTPLARWILYLRGHWLRMPPRLLFIHLARKLFATPKNVSASP